MLRTRLFLNLLPFVVVLLATGIYAIVLFSRLTHSVDVAVAEHYRGAVAAQQMILALAGIDREAWAASATGNTNSRAALAAHRRRFESNLSLQLKNVSIPGEKELNNQLATNYSTFHLALGKLNSLSRLDGKHQIYEQELVPLQLKMNRLLDKILDMNQRAILATSPGVQQITREVTRLMMIGMGVALVLSAIACYRLSRSILEPIQHLTQATRALGEGNLNQVVPVESRGELGELAQAFNTMAAQLQEYRQSTSEEIVRLHRVMETTLASFPDPIFVLNRKGEIELKNPAATELASALRSNGRLPERLQMIADRALQRGENFLPHSFNEVVAYRIEGSEKSFLPRVLAMRTKADALFGVAVVLYDVTRFRLLDAAKTDLVATVSHELKTPLTSVRMVLHLLLEKTLGGLTPKQDELLQTARNDTERLLRILNHLLDLARLEEGNAELHREPVPAAELLQMVASETVSAASAKGLKLNCLVQEGLPPVSVDRQRIYHVLANLVTNAMKHSPPGGEILLRASSVEDNAVQLSVTDRGPGIPPEYHTRIFDRFFRVPGQSKSGAGLGLSIAREITVAHGGRIGVKSIPGQGAMFYVVLKGLSPAV